MFNRSYINPHKNHPHYIKDSKILNIQKTAESIEKKDHFFSIMRNLSDPTKMRIYLLLEKVEEISVTDLTIILGISQSAVSHALSDLKNIGLIESKRCGKLICYFLNKEKKKNKILSFKI